MRLSIEILAIGAPDKWGDRRVAFYYALGMRGDIQNGWLVEIVNCDYLAIMPSILAHYVNCTRPPSQINRWL